MPTEIGLQELLHQVKQELLTQSETDSVPLFYVEGVDLELSFIARKEGTAGIKLYVLDLNGSSGKEATQTVHIHLTPILSHDKMRRIVEQDPKLETEVEDISTGGILKGLVDK